MKEHLVQACDRNLSRTGPKPIVTSPQVELTSKNRLIGEGTHWRWINPTSSSIILTYKWVLIPLFLYGFMKSNSIFWTIGFSYVWGRSSRNGLRVFFSFLRSFRRLFLVRYILDQNTNANSGVSALLVVAGERNKMCIKLVKLLPLSFCFCWSGVFADSSYSATPILSIGASLLWTYLSFSINRRHPRVFNWWFTCKYLPFHLYLWK